MKKSVIFIAAFILLLSSFIVADLNMEQNYLYELYPQRNDLVFIEDAYYECEFIPEFPSYCIMLA